jgi:hypothetical protein
MDPLSVLPEILPHAVRVLAFFPGGRRHPGKYATFEYLIFLQANAASVACERALSILRSVHDDPDELEKLGPRVKPSFYAVVWVCYVELPDGAAAPFEHPMVINYFTLEEQELEALKTHAKARVPVRLQYFEQ